MQTVSGSRILPAALRGWSRRRGLAVALLLGPLAAAYASIGPGFAVAWAVPAVLWCAVPAAVLLASYVGEPGSGRRVDVGCSPCAAVAGLAVLGSMVMKATAPLDPGIALVAGLLVDLGALQRLGAVAGCPAAPPG